MSHTVCNLNLSCDFWQFNIWASLANGDVFEHSLGGGRCLKLTVVAVCCKWRGGRIHVFEVTRVTQQVSVQRIAAVTLLVIQLYMTVLREEIHIHITLTSFSIVRYVQIFVNNTSRHACLKRCFLFFKNESFFTCSNHWEWH